MWDPSHVVDWGLLNTVMECTLQRTGTQGREETMRYVFASLYYETP